MDNALALALLEIEGSKVLNFRKGPFADRKDWIEYKKDFIKTGVLAGIVIGIAGLNIILDSYSMEKKIAGLNTQITNIFKTTFPEVQKIVDPRQQMRVKIKQARKQSISPQSSGKNIRKVDILHDISELIPKNSDVELARIVIGPGSVLISGTTDTFNAVNNIQLRLEKSELFKTVTINSANIEKSGNRVNFKLKIQL